MMLRRPIRYAIVLVLLAALCLAACADSSRGKTKVLVLFAGSLLQPLGEVERRFELANPDIDLELEGHGSIQAIRQVSDIHREADVVISADEALIPMLMYTSDNPDTGEAYADWQIEFATNEMCLAYSDDSLYADEINAENWYDIIRRPDVRIGISDPRFDSNGYRGLMVLKMAERYYDEPTLFFDMTAGKLTEPILTSVDAQVDVINVPEIVETVPGSTLVIRMNSVQLLPLLQSGDLDYAFEYQSVTKQHGLRYVDLPPELDLGTEALNARYESVRVDVALQNYRSVAPSFVGSSVVYGATIPSNSTNPRGAERFLAFLLGPEGRAILVKYDHPTLVPARAANHILVPAPLRPLLEPNDGTGPS